MFVVRVGGVGGRGAGRARALSTLMSRRVRRPAAAQDGVYPEKVNAGRTGVNDNMRRIGQNVNPIKVKFSGQGAMDL